MRAYNFCAGPAALPTAVLEKAQAETNWANALATLATEIVPVPTEAKPEVEEG